MTNNISWSGPKLDGKLDYNFWEIQMTAYLRAHNLWSFIEAGINEDADGAVYRRDQLALSVIHQGVDYSEFGKIANAKSAKEAWDMLKLSYKGVEKAQKSKLQSLRREFERYEMIGSESVAQYFFRVIDLVNRMRLYGEKIPDNKVVEKILRTLPVKYDYVVTTIMESYDTDKMTVAELQGILESHINRILEKTEKSHEEGALKSQVNLHNIPESSQSYNNRGRGRGNFRGRNRGNYQNRGNNFSQQFFNQSRNNNFSTRGRGRDNYYNERTNF